MLFNSFENKEELSNPRFIYDCYHISIYEINGNINVF